jgi:hypothetical protein
MMLLKLVIRIEQNSSNDKQFVIHPVSIASLKPLLWYTLKLYGCSNEGETMLDGSRYSNSSLGHPKLYRLSS